MRAYAWFNGELLHLPSDYLEGMVISAVCLSCVESTLSDDAYPYWPKKERKLKKRHPVLMAELRDLHADVMCLQARLVSPWRRGPPDSIPSATTSSSVAIWSGCQLRWGGLLWSLPISH